MPFFCKKRHETMDEACAYCEDCPGSGENVQLHSRKKSMHLEDVFEAIGGLAGGNRRA